MELDFLVLKPRGSREWRVATPLVQFLFEQGVARSFLEDYYEKFERLTPEESRKICIEIERLNQIFEDSKKIMGGRYSWPRSLEAHLFDFLHYDDALA